MYFQQTYSRIMNMDHEYSQYVSNMYTTGCRHVEGMVLYKLIMCGDRVIYSVTRPKTKKKRKKDHILYHIYIFVSIHILMW